MRVKTGICAVAIAFGIAAASRSTAQPSIATVFTPYSNGLKTVASVVATRADLCNTNCYIPLEQCVATCGDTLACKHKCGCKLFANPKFFCRTQGCVTAPQGCSHAKRDSTESFGRHVDISTATSTAPQSTNVGTQMADGMRPLPVPPYNPCVNCQYAVNSCTKKCKTPGFCVDACACYEKKHNINCINCGIKPGCTNDEHWTPLAKLFSRYEEFRQSMAIPNDTKEATIPEKPNTPQAAEISQDPCHICRWKMALCKRKKCPDQPGCDKKQKWCPKECDNFCSCDTLDQFPLCSDNCGVKCPFLSDSLRRKGEGIDPVSASEATEIDPMGLPTARPPNTCEICLQSFHSCRKMCHTPGSCDQECECSVAQKSLCRSCPFKCR